MTLVKFEYKAHVVLQALAIHIISNLQRMKQQFFTESQMRK